eukprot:CAMPEP_0203934244 /NCGR_PEP_ID=MMETSP0359-20131031/72245_1 /ASSEMBLY_ACC=CAM_ASM_000338 /TAXON_ID=268821 /ORGANISM="Scrippsiella Hangoei, Strain SHTV-5" /LENGTH=62 /DNA_ID=CAMNT_0050863935 /DNA_START=110 /DNA_END=295 /DNA_ORIENTATION=-
MCDVHASDTRNIPDTETSINAERMKVDPIGQETAKECETMPLLEADEEKSYEETERDKQKTE